MGIVVRRGALRRFATLTRETAEHGVAVSWDRRQTDRRGSPGPAGADQRKADRRQKPPYTWELADFVVLSEAEHEVPKAHPRARSSSSSTIKKKRA